MKPFRPAVSAFISTCTALTAVALAAVVLMYQFHLLTDPPKILIVLLVLLFGYQCAVFGYILKSDHEYNRDYNEDDQND